MTMALAKVIEQLITVQRCSVHHWDDLPSVENSSGSRG